MSNAGALEGLMPKQSRIIRSGVRCQKIVGTLYLNSY